MRRDAYGVIVRLVIDGRDAEPFSLTTRPVPPPWPGRAADLRAAARARGLSLAARQELADARRAGPAARTTTRAGVNPTSPPINPTSDPTEPTDDPTDTTRAAEPGVQAPPPTRMRPPQQRKARKRS
jgi:hypothetical protein